MQNLYQNAGALRTLHTKNRAKHAVTVALNAWFDAHFSGTANPQYAKCVESALAQVAPVVWDADFAHIVWCQAHQYAQVAQLPSAVCAALNAHARAAYAYACAIDAD